LELSSDENCTIYYTELLCVKCFCSEFRWTYGVDLVTPKSKPYYLQNTNKPYETEKEFTQMPTKMIPFLKKHINFNPFTRAPKKIMYRGKWIEAYDIFETDDGPMVDKLYVTKRTDNGEYLQIRISTSGELAAVTYQQDGSDETYNEVFLDNGNVLEGETCKLHTANGLTDIKCVRNEVTDPFVEGESCESKFLASCRNHWFKIEKERFGGTRSSDSIAFNSADDKTLDDCPEIKLKSKDECRPKTTHRSSAPKPICVWKSGFFPRKVTGKKSCRDDQSATLCVGYVVCMKDGEEQERLATCGPENCKLEKATQCARQGGYYSKAVTKEDKKWRAPVEIKSNSSSVMEQ
jgi:hypothetical protein